METIKVNFVDFWVNFIKTDNYFYNLLSTTYKVVIDENNPDIVFYSVDYDRKNEKSRYLNTSAKMIYYTGESTLPNWNECDLAFTFDYDCKNQKNYRLPLWALYLNWFNRDYNPNRDQAYLHNLDDFLNKKINKIEHLKTHSHFCNFVYSNPVAHRINFYQKFSSRSHRHIVSAGRVMNNTGNGIPGRSDTIEKMHFLKKFKFTIAFENKDYLGYTTEKLIHPMFCNSLPIYWGNDKVGITDFNPKSFIQAKSFSNDDELIDYINTVDNDLDLYFSILEEPWFVNNKIPEFVLPDNVLKQIMKVL